HGAALNTFYLTNGKYQANYSLNPTTDAAAPIFPNTLGAAAGSAGLVSVEFAAPNFRNPYTQQANFSIERELTRDFGLTASYIWTRGIAFFTVRDLNIGPPGGTATYSILDSNGTQTGTFTTPVYLLRNRIDTRYRSIYQAENGGQSWYNAFALQLR